MIIKPLFKWAGSKRRMIQKYEDTLQFGEPSAFVDLFGGTGLMSVWFHIKYPTKPIFLNEFNTDIYHIYNSIKNDYDYFISVVNDLEDQYMSNPDKDSRKSFYLNIREKYHNTYHNTSFKEKTPVLYFMMCTNFNGIWQAKRATGIYYTPFGNGNQKTGVYDREAMSSFKGMVDVAHITNLSYEKVTGYPDGSLVFMDPPYVDSHTQYDRRNAFVHSMQEDSANLAMELMNNHNVVFCNKTHQMFFDVFGESLIHQFDVTYTGGATSKKAVEIIATNIKKLA